MIFWINLYAFVFTLRLSWILNTQMVSPCQLCCLVGVCWWWQENLDTFGPTGRYRNDLDDRVPFALWEFSFFLLWATRTMPHVCMLSLLGLNPQGQLWLFFFFFPNNNLLFWKFKFKEELQAWYSARLHLPPRYTSREHFAMCFICLLCVIIIIFA